MSLVGVGVQEVRWEGSGWNNRSPNIVRVIESRRLRGRSTLGSNDHPFNTIEYNTGCASHVARVEEGRNAFKILTGKPDFKSRFQALQRTSSLKK